MRDISKEREKSDVSKQKIKTGETQNKKGEIYYPSSQVIFLMLLMQAVLRY